MTSTRFTTDAGRELFLNEPMVVVAGYTGRNEAKVQEHINELAAIGIPPPDTVPAFYNMQTSSLTSEQEIVVSGDFTSGEVEPVLIFAGGEYFLGVGSDHTDRDLERTSIAASKQACPKPVGAQVLPIPETFEWDLVRIRSWVDGSLYQDGTLAELRIPISLVQLSDGTLSEDRDFVLFCGTVPLIDGQFVPGETWRIELTTPEGFFLNHTYRTTQLTQ